MVNINCTLTSTKETMLQSTKSIQDGGSPLPQERSSENRDSVEWERGSPADSDKLKKRRERVRTGMGDQMHTLTLLACTSQRG